MCGGTDAQPQVDSWGLSREPPDTLTEQDLRPCQTGQRPEKPAAPQLWRLSWGSFYFRCQSQGSRKPLSSLQQLMTGCPAAPLRNSLAIFMYRRWPGAPSRNCASMGCF